MKKFFSFFILLCLLFSSYQDSFAQTTTPPPTSPPEPTTNEAYTLTPELQDIDDATYTVKVKFNDPNLFPGGKGKVFVCMESDLCIDNDGIREGIFEGKESSRATASLGMDKDKVDEKTIQRYVLDSTNSIEVCGDGNKKLKAIGSDGNGNHPYYLGANGKYWDDRDDPGCQPERDYFHPGVTYSLAVYTVGNNDGDETWELRDIAGFYVNHHAPSLMEFIPPGNFNPSSASFKITLEADKTKAWGKDRKEYRNNYQVQFQAPGYTESRCGYVYQGEPQVVEFKPNTTLRAGKFRISIREQINENDLIFQYNGNNPINYTDNVAQLADKINKSNPVLRTLSGESLCQGGFIYRLYNCNLTSTDGKTMSAACEKNKVPNPKYDPTKPIGPGNERWEYLDYIDDPNKVDVRGLLAYFDRLGVDAADTRYPCNIGGTTMKDPSGCKVVKTAIGDIPTDPLGFIMRIFSIVLSIAGVGAIIIIIFSGYRMMLSRGNPEAIKSAREALTSAVVGLVFIVFSLVLLSVIAGNVLKIPGFTDETVTTQPGMNDSGFQP